MNFTAWQFLWAFLPLSIIAFALLKNTTSRQLFLIAASLFFYAYSGASNAVVLVTSIIVNYYVGSTLCALSTPNRKRRLFTLWLGVIGNLSCLLTFKVLALSSGEGEGFRTEQDILIPLALSFITFQQIGFIYSCYKRTIKHVRPLSYLFFIAFFPQLIMGPIVRYEDIDQQLKKGNLKQFSFENLAVGLSIFGFGLAKKVLLADYIFIYVDQVFTTAVTTQVSTTDMWYAVIAFQLQLFLDFSAYADMAIGLARIFGINLPVNFDRPLRARDRFDVWRRWHISFVVFMRSHVFRPLISKAKLPIGVALAITGLLSGVWHGLGWTFILWGALQTLLMLGTHYRKKIFNSSDRGGRARAFFSIAATFLVTCLMAAVFRTPTIDGVVAVYGQLMTWNPLPSVLSLRSYVVLIVCAFVAWVWPDTHQLFHRYWNDTDLRPINSRPRGFAEPSWIEFRLSLAWACIAGLTLVICCLLLSQSGRFIYVQF
ncbi:MBOAT family O-acyltransferase [Porticoccus sp.]